MKSDILGRNDPKKSGGRSKCSSDVFITWWTVIFGDFPGSHSDVHSAKLLFLQTTETIYKLQESFLDSSISIL